MNEDKIEKELLDFNFKEYKSYFKMKHSLKDDNDYANYRENILNYNMDINDFNCEASKILDSVNLDIIFYKKSKSIHRFKDKNDYDKGKKLFSFICVSLFFLILYFYNFELSFIYLLIMGVFGENKIHEKIFFGDLKAAHFYILRTENHLNDIKTLSNKIERLPSEYDQTNAKLKIKYLEDKLKSQNDFLKHAIEWNK